MLQKSKYNYYGDVRKRRNSKEMFVFRKEMLERFKRLSKEEQYSIWQKFYGNTDLNKKIKQTVWWLLWANNLLAYFEDIYQQVLFDCFQKYLTYYFEGRHNPAHLEKVAVYNARYFTIYYHILKLKKFLSLEMVDEQKDAIIEMDSAFIKLRQKLQKRISKRAMEFFDKLYEAHGNIKLLKNDYPDYECLLRELSMAI